MLRLRPDLFRPPALRSEGEQQDRHATWLEVFYDLVFAAVIAQLASLLSVHHTPIELLRASLLFVTVWWAWVGQTFYLTRFDTDDIGHRLLTLLQILAVAAMAAYLPGALGQSAAGFALSYSGVRIVLIVEYLRAGQHAPAARKLTSAYALGFTGAVLLWLASIQVPPPWRYNFWALAIAVDFLAPALTAPLAIKFPPHLQHVPERLGQFTVIVIGETVVDAVTGLGRGSLSLSTGITLIMGLIIAFTLAWGYFDGVSAGQLRRLETTEQLRKYRVWLYSHLPLTLSITIMAASIKYLVVIPAGATVPRPAVWTLCGGLALAMWMLDTLFMSSPDLQPTPELRRWVLPHYLIPLVVLAVGLAGHLMSAPLLVTLLALCSVAQILFSLRIRPIPQSETSR